MKRSLFVRSLLVLTLALAFGCTRDDNKNSVRGYPAPKNEKPGAGTVVIYGDSLSSGVGSETPYSEHLRTKLGGNVLNTAVAGINSQQAVQQFDQLVLQFNPKLVIFTIGGNDAMKEPRLTKTDSINNMLKMIELAQAKGALVVYLGINPPVKKLFPEVQDVPDDQIEAAFGVSRFSEMVHQARSAGALAIDDCMNGIWLNENLKADKLHPNSQGSKIIADQIMTLIGPSYP